MASLADAIVKGGFGTIGVIASAYTLTKFIIATPVKIGDRSDEERDKDVVLCFDIKAFSPAAIAFFLDSVRAQSRLRIDKKRVHSHKPITPTATGDDATVQDPEVLAEAQGEAYYLVGATTEVLKQIKARKRKMQHAEIFDETDGKPLTSGERIELLMFELNRLLVFAPASGTEASIPSPFQVNDSLFAQALHSRLIKEHFPLHDDRERHDLVETWVKKYDQPQPLDAVHDYFGDEIGFYFAFLGMYTKWLVVPTAIGVVVFLVEALTPWSAYGRAFYSLFITSWATAFLKFWRRRESTLRDQWDISVTDTLALDQERPEFSGERRYDPVEDRHFTYFSSIKRMQRYLVTSVVTLAVLGVILKLMFLYFDIDKWVGEQVTLEKGWDGYYQYASLAPSVAYSIVVLLLDMKYLELATWLTKMENHRTDADFSNALVLKLASFYFVNNFGSLFFLAFRSRDMELLEQTLSSLLITRQLIGNVKEQLVPYFTATSSLKTEAGKIAKEEHVKEAVLSKVDAELLFPTYDGTFDDYLELFVQFGQVTLFASAYPLAALWSLTNNLMEIRSDAFKLCASFRRSRRISSAGIGTWFYAFNALGYMSVMTNCAIIGLHSGLLDRLFPALSHAGILVAIGAFEHIMVGIKVCIELLVPDTPTSVLEAQRMERAQLRKKAILQAELSTRKLILQVEQSEANMSLDPPASGELDKTASREKMLEWLRQEKDRRSKLEQEVKTLNDLYMGWIREEQEKRKIAEAKVAELLRESEKAKPANVAKAQ